MSALAQQAARLWSLRDLTLVAQRENAVWRATGPSGPVALRLHRPGYRSPAELQSELDWMAMLAAGGLPVPRPVPSDAGRLVDHVGDTPVSVLGWLPGRISGVQGALDGIADRAGHMRALGALLARLHDLSDRWTPPPGFTRPRWDAAGLLEMPLWGPFWDNPGLTGDQRALVLKARDRARAALAARSPDLSFGLIHADAVTENVMVDGATLTLIDFDDGGYGFRDFDLATVLLRQRTAPDYPALRAALLAGYARPAPALDLMLMLRAMSYVGWVIPRLAEPGGTDRAAAAIARLMPLVTACLEAPDA